MSDATIDVILPAGGRITGAFAEEAGVEIKALIPIGGRAVLERTLDTLQATGRVRRIVIVGPDELASHSSARTVDAVLPEGASGPDNIFRGMQWLREANNGQHPDRVMVITTDLPFLTPEALAIFLNACPDDADISIPLVTKDAFEERFPGSVNEYVPLLDGNWTMGCAFLVNPAALEANRATIDRVFAARKSQFAMAKMLGLSFIIRFLTHRLTVSDIERRCVQILRTPSCGIRRSAPELAFDIDLPEEYRYARKHFSE